jgi:hypothetical protein
MTEINNFTPFPHLRFSNSDNQGREFGVVMVKAAFDIGEDGACLLSSEQEPFSFTDACHGEVNVTSLKTPSDFVSYKPNADLVFDAIAHSPTGKPAKSWIVGIKVSSNEGTLLEKQIRVTGPRYWVPKWTRKLNAEEAKNWRRHKAFFSGWELSEPQPVLQVPIRYELAFGGSVAKGTDDDGNQLIEAYQYNPLGVGLLDRKWSDHTQTHLAPQVEAINDPIREPYKHYKPVGFGPIPPAWLPRRELGGTFDQNWIDTVWPRWPKDYDFAYNNSAAQGLVLDGYPDGDLQFELRNIRDRQSDFNLRIPDPQLYFALKMRRGNVQLIRPCLDTVILSVAANDTFECRACYVWRTPFLEPETSSISVYCATSTAQAPSFESMDTLRQAPAPDECAVVSDLLGVET